MAEPIGALWQKLIDDTIRQATENVAYEIERDAEQKVAAILRERGWVVIPLATPGGDS